jgi:hypothetical protein
MPVELSITGNRASLADRSERSPLPVCPLVRGSVIEEVATHRVVGALSKGGKEGHVTEREAAAKAVRVMQQEFASDLARSVAAHVYGEMDLPASAATPSGCPKEAVQPPVSR